MAIHQETGPRHFVLGNAAKKVNTRTESRLTATVSRTLFKSFRPVKTLLRFLRGLLPMRQHELPWRDLRPGARQESDGSRGPAF